MADGELICVPSDDEDEAPAPKKSTLTSFWKQPDEEVGEPSTPFKRRRVGDPSTPPSHHRLGQVLASRGGESSSRAFHESLAQLRAQRIDEAAQLRAQRIDEAAAAECAAQSKHERVLREKTGKLTPPEEQRRGVKRGIGVGGRPIGTKAAYETRHKPLSAPMLRRDPTAQEKLAILAEWNKACDKEGVESICELRGATK